MPDLTDNHDLQLWAAGEQDWEHRADMTALDTAVEIRDTEANLTNYTAKDGAKFHATDTDAVYTGDGTNWNAVTFKPTADHISDTTNPHSVTASQANALPDTGGSVAGDITLESAAGLQMGLGSDIYPTVDSSQASGDDPNFNLTITDSQAARPEIHWRRRVNAADSTVDEAFSVYDSTNNNDLFEVLESGKVDINHGGLGISGELGVGGGARFIGSDVSMENAAELEFQSRSDIRTSSDSTGSADEREFNLRHSDVSGADEIHWLRNTANAEALAVRNSTVGSGNRLFVVDDSGNATVDGDLSVGGTVDGAQTTVTVTADHTASDGEIVIVDASGGAVTVTLPGTADAVVDVKLIDATNSCTIATPGSETIDDQTEEVLDTQYQSRTIAFDGTDYWIV